MLMRRKYRCYYLIVVYLHLIELKRIYCLPDARATCRTIPGLTRDQLELCYRANDVTSAALEGLELAIRECQYQFRWNRWNCSSLSTKSRYPHSSNLFKRGYRESAFAYAISAAGVVHNVARACSQGQLLSCGCDPSSHRKSLNKSLRDSLERWKWGGCSHNMDFGNEFSEIFLDSREKAGDIQSQINLHNNQVGRLAVKNNMQVRCKCHGMSGSCQLKTCWMRAPDFRVVGKILKQQFRRAVLVDQSNFGTGVVVHKQKTKKRKSTRFRPAKAVKKDKSENDSGNWKKKNRKNRLENSLFYYQRSPNFCERDQTSDIPGTIGRRCNRTSIGSDSCSSMCCGRGYNLIKEKRIDRCNCKFHWCCYVECEECLVEEWISICN
ncbi:unnamed protein product [Diamesa tonsa]